MEKVLILVMIIVSSIGLNAQNQNKIFVLIELEIENKGIVHPSGVDYWIISLEKWENSQKNSVVPFYFKGLHQTEINECLDNDTTLFFNYEKGSYMELDKKTIEALDHLEYISKKYRKKVMTINKRWSKNYSSTINVFLTPFIGEVIFCPVLHHIKKELIFEAIGIPISDISYNDEFWDSDICEEVSKHDYSELEQVFLENVN